MSCACTSTNLSYKIDKDLVIKVADFGLARDIYADDYYRMEHKTRLPIKWMPPESILDKYYDQRTDVVCNVKYMMNQDAW